MGIWCVRRSNLAFESQHLLHAVEAAGIKNWVSLSEGQQGTLGWLTTNERKVRNPFQPHCTRACADARACVSSNKCACCCARRSRWGGSRSRTSSFQTRLKHTEAKLRIKDELSSYCVVTEPPKTTFGKVKPRMPANHRTARVWIRGQIRAMAEEAWVSIADDLKISSFGRVKAFDKVHGLRGPYEPNPGSNGYVSFQHNKKRYYLAHEVATAFLGPPADDETIDHINQKRDDNRVSNLRWATRTEQRLNQAGRENRNAREPDANQTDLPGERWHTLDRIRVSTKGRAQVMYSHGNVWGPIFTPMPSRKNTYAEIGRGWAFHRLVAQAFLAPPPNKTYTVDHIDGNRTNNVLENLRWASKRLQSLNRRPNRIPLTALSKRVMVLDSGSNTWIEFPSFTAAAKHLQSVTDKTFSAAGVGLAAKRSGTYHGIRMRLAG